jgi:desulfoferrodoxin-like iron-binding protein
MSDAPVLGGIHRMEDFDTADDYTKKHTPYIGCAREGDACIVDVAVGHYVPHPNMPDHFFEYIELCVDDACVARFDFSAVAVSPKVTATLNLDPGTKLTARASCNLHGVWASEITV